MPETLRQNYAMPRAEAMPPLAVSFNPVPNPSNELGVKGIGEGGACGAPPAIVSAVSDALGVGHIDMPLLPVRIWRTLRRNGQLPRRAVGRVTGSGRCRSDCRDGRHRRSP